MKAHVYYRPVTLNLLVRASIKQIIVQLKSPRKMKPKNLKILFISLAILQILDGVLTYIAVSNYGYELEGNILIQYLLSFVGAGCGLLLAKTFALTITYLVYKRLTTTTYQEALIFFCYVVAWVYFFAVTIWILLFLDILSLKL